MKAILINPEDQTIKEIDIKKGINAMYKAIDCDGFAAPVTYDNGDTMYCDDEGLFKHGRPNPMECRPRVIEGYTRETATCR